ncbi:unnamed protein product [Camellia sinensis]
MRKAKMAMKKGVVEPMAWLNETGRKRIEMLPETTEKQKMAERAWEKKTSRLVMLLTSAYVLLMRILGLLRKSSSRIENSIIEHQYDSEQLKIRENEEDNRSVIETLR